MIERSVECVCVCVYVVLSKPNLKKIIETFWENGEKPFGTKFPSSAFGKYTKKEINRANFSLIMKMNNIFLSWRNN